MKEIRLYVTPQGWMSVCASHRALFGTDTVPTAFTARCSEAVVLSEMRKLNPGCDVQVVRPVVPWGDRQINS